MWEINNHTPTTQRLEGKLPPTPHRRWRTKIDIVDQDILSSNALSSSTEYPEFEVETQHDPSSFGNESERDGPTSRTKQNGEVGCTTASVSFSNAEFWLDDNRAWWSIKKKKIPELGVWLRSNYLRILSIHSHFSLMKEFALVTWRNSQMRIQQRMQHWRSNLLSHLLYRTIHTQSGRGIAHGELPNCEQPLRGKPCSTLSPRWSIFDTLDITIVVAAYSLSLSLSLSSHLSTKPPSTSVNNRIKSKLFLHTSRILV